MGQRINPVGFRLKETNHWLSQWCDHMSYPGIANEDIQIRSFLQGLFMSKDLLVGEIKIVRHSVRNELLLEVELLAKSSLVNQEYDALLQSAQVGLTNLLASTCPSIYL